ncbi:MAG: alpha/beta hydrolase [Nakamurella sp.]
MTEIELSAGMIDYLDTGGDGPVIVLLHGLLMDNSLWASTLGQLSADFRCVAPTLPMGAHRRPMRADADLSLAAIALLVAEFLDRLALCDVTLVGNDTGGALVQLMVGQEAPRINRIMLTSCEAFDNFPAGITGQSLALVGKLSPRLFGLFMQQLRFRPIRRLPLAFGWLTKRGDASTAQWTKPILQQPGIRRDAVRMLRAFGRGADILVQAAEVLPAFDRPALVVWASEDRVMPPAHGRRLAELLPQGQLIQIADSYTLLPLDQPDALAQVIREFVQKPVGQDFS